METIQDAAKQSVCSNSCNYKSYHNSAITRKTNTNFKILFTFFEHNMSPQLNWTMR